MKELIESKWQEILNILVKEHEISEVAVNTWIQPLIIQTITDDSITFFMVLPINIAITIAPQIPVYTSTDR